MKGVAVPGGYDDGMSATTSSSTLQEPLTPFAVLDRSVIDANIDRLERRLADLNLPLRLHVKTSKSVDVTRRVHREGPQPIAVSTLAEAEYFADDGYTDILYAVGLAPAKLDRVVALHARGVDLSVLVDNTDQAEAVAAASRVSGHRIPALVEIDCDGHRSGVRAESPELIEIARILHDGGAELRGVLDHAGESYFSTGAEAQARDADAERAALITAAQRLREAGMPCPVLSSGSTPTAHSPSEKGGMTELRAGNFVFFDLVMAGIGVCDLDDIALSVVVTVIGHQSGKGWILTDGGWMAMSRDRGTAAQKIDQGYGVVATLDGEIIPDLLMTGASQEHGILELRHGSGGELPELPVGTRLRVLPNHACATASQYQEYSVVDRTGDPTRILENWPRCHGW